MTEPTLTQRNLNAQRIRLTFAKGEAVKFISHLDLVKAWERILRRASIPLVYSQGFHPKPKMQMAASLPVGYTGDSELLDIYLDKKMEPAQIEASLRMALPRDIELLEVKEVTVKAPALQSILQAADYLMAVETQYSADDLEKRLIQIISSEKLEIDRMRQRRMEKVDIRPFIIQLRLLGKEDSEARFWLRLKSGPQGNLRLETIVSVMGLENNIRQMKRIGLHFAS